MLYAFTVTKHSTEYMPIFEIRPFEYRIFWQKVIDQGGAIVYKFMHQKNDEGLKHVHFHGLIIAERLDYSQLTMEGYSVKIVPEDMEHRFYVDGKFYPLEVWHHYCKHEYNDELKAMQKKLNEEDEKRIYRECLKSASKGTAKQTKIQVTRTSSKSKSNAPWKIVITGSI